MYSGANECKVSETTFGTVCVSHPHTVVLCFSLEAIIIETRSFSFQGLSGGRSPVEYLATD